MRKYIIQFLKAYLDYSYRAEDNKLIIDLQDQVLHYQQKANQWQGKWAIMRNEVTTLNRVLAKRNRSVAYHRDLLKDLKKRHPSIFPVKGSVKVKTHISSAG